MFSRAIASKFLKKYGVYAQNIVILTANDESNGKRQESRGNNLDLVAKNRLTHRREPSGCTLPTDDDAQGRLRSG